MWTIVISTLAIGFGYRFFGPTSLPKWTTDISSVAGGIIVVALILLIGRAGVRVAQDNRVSTKKLIVLTLIGIGCSEASIALPILGLGTLLAIYGFPGLVVIGLRRLSQRGKNNPTGGK